MENENLTGFNLIEDFIKKDGIITIPKIQEIAKLIDFEAAKLKIPNKKLYFLRHGNAEHNEWKWKLVNIITRTKCPIIDPKLTLKGQEEAAKNKDRVREIGIDLVYCSPLTRTIQTCLISTDLINTDIILIPQLRERLKKNSDIGSCKDTLKDSYTDHAKLNFSFMAKKYWWNSDESDDINTKHSVIKESDLDFEIRIWLIIILCLLKDEEKILIVSHSKVHKLLSPSFFGISTGDVRSLDVKGLEFFLDSVHEKILTSK